MTEEPTLDGRDREALFDHAIALTPHYVDEWDPEADDAGAALMGLFAELAEEVVERLDQFPAKHRVAFFDALGFSQGPPQLATVPLAFEVTDGADEPVAIPGGTRAVAEGPSETFETGGDDGFEATPASVDRVYSVDPGRDRIFEHSEGLGGTEPVELFGGTDLQEHVLYLAGGDLLALAPGSWIRVILGTDARLSTVANLVWEYYGENAEGEADWHLLTVRNVEETDEANRTVTVTLEMGDTAVERTVDGIESKWIRCRDSSSGSAPELFDLEFRSTEIATGGHIPADLLLRGDVPLDPDGGSIRPFGRLPRERDTFYVASEEAFTKAGVRVIVRFDGWLAEDSDGDPELSWEYWNGDGWSRLAVEDTSTGGDGGEANDGVGEADGDGDGRTVGNMQRAGSVGFDVPSDLVETSVAGHDGYWIRVRLVAGDYGTVTYEETDDGTFVEGTDDVHPPHYERLTIRYSERRTPTALVSSNNLAYAHVAGSPRRPIRPFEPVTGEEQTVYVGFDRALMGGPVNLLFAFSDAEYEAGFYPRVRWERWDPDENVWTRLAVRDRTESLTERGIASLVFEAETSPTEQFGDERHWIRARVTGDEFAPGSAKRKWEDPAGVSVEVGEIYAESELVVIDNVGDRPIDLSGYRIDFEFGEPAVQVRTFPVGTVIPTGESLIVATGSKSEGPRDVTLDYNRWVLNRVDADTVAIKTPGGHLVAKRTDDLETPRWPESGEGRPKNGGGSRNADSDRTAEDVDGEADGDECGGTGATARLPPPCERTLASTPPMGEPTRGPPVLDGLYLNAVWAQHARTVTEEVVGTSDGTPLQTFRVANPPAIDASVWVEEARVLSEGVRRELLAERPDRVTVETGSEGETRAVWVEWSEVPSFRESSGEDRHYTLDRTAGRVEFGDGTRGRIPPAGSDNVRVTYRTGGGVAGNVDRGAIEDLQRSIPLVESVTNPLPADGGADAESREAVLDRAPGALRDRGRAVTARDFERIAKSTSRKLARVRCVSAMDRAGERVPGAVTLLVVPSGRGERPVPSVTLRDGVRSAVADRAPATLVADPDRFVVRGPSYVVVDARVSLSATPGSLSAVEEAATDALASYLHPLTGGEAGDGWAFGETPCHSGLFALLEGVERVDHVAELTVRFRESGSVVTVRKGEEAPQLAPDALIHSGSHEIDVAVGQFDAGTAGGGI